MILSNFLHNPYVQEKNPHMSVLHLSWCACTRKVVPVPESMCLSQCKFVEVGEPLEKRLCLYRSEWLTQNAVPCTKVNMCWSGECLYQSERASTTYMCLCPNECTCTSILCVVMCCSPQERSHCGQRVQLRQLEKKFVRCSIRVLISHLKAMLHKKLSVPLDLKVNTFLCSHLPSQGHAVQKKCLFHWTLRYTLFCVLISHLKAMLHKNYLFHWTLR